MANVEKKLTEQQMSQMDKAIAAAKARLEAKKRATVVVVGGGNEKSAKVPAVEENVVEENEKISAESKKVSKAAKLAAEEKSKADREAKRLEEKAKTEQVRAEKKASRQDELAQKKAVREAAKAEREAKRNASKKTAHMGKVEKAASLLPALSASGKAFFDTVTEAGLTSGELTALCAHLAHHNRFRSTMAAVAKTTELEIGARVRVVSSDRDPRLIGLEGYVTHVGKIRVNVDLGRTRDAYLFTSDVELVEETKEEEHLAVEAPIVETVAAEDEGPQFLAPEVEGATGTDGE